MNNQAISYPEHTNFKENNHFTNIIHLPPKHQEDCFMITN